MGQPLHQNPDDDHEVLFSVQSGPQAALVACPVQEIFYGGARGGGKTFGVILDWTFHAARYGSDAKGILFRRTYRELEEVIDAARKICVPLGASYRAGQFSISMPNGAVLKFRHLNRDADADNYQGHQYCVAKGTPILLANGTQRAIEDVSVAR